MDSTLFGFTVLLGVHTHTHISERGEKWSWLESERGCVRPKVLLTADIARAVSKLFFTQAAVVKTREREREKREEERGKNYGVGGPTQGPFIFEV